MGDQVAQVTYVEGLGRGGWVGGWVERKRGIGWVGWWVMYGEESPLSSSSSSSSSYLDMRRLQNHPTSHARVARLLPARRTQAPFIPFHQAREGELRAGGDEIVAP